MDELIEIAGRIKAEAHRLGVAKFDVFGRMARDTTVKVENGTPGQMAASQKVSFAMRVWEGAKAPGVAYTSDLSSDGIAAALALAREAARHLESSEQVDFSPEAKAPLLREALAIDLADASVNAMFESLRAAEASLLAAHPSVKGVPYNVCREGHAARLYLNSDGALRCDAFPSAFAYLLARAEEEGKKPRAGFCEIQGRTFSELEMARCAEETRENLLSHLDYVKVASGKALVVFSPEAILTLIGAFGNFINARQILDNQSLTKSEMLGTPLASPLLTLVDDVGHPGNILGPVAFDEEGTPTRRTDLVVSGKLVGLVHTAATAKRMNVPCTGNASIGSKVTCGLNYLVVERGESPVRERCVAEEPYAVYIDELEAIHAGVHPLQGSFSLPFKGWVWENGVRRSIEAAVVSGDFFSLLRDIVFVGAKASPRSGGCAPEVWVEGLAITGE
jgi:PmbA protein